MSTPSMSPDEAIRRVAQAREALVGEVHKVIIGQDEMIEQMLICMFARGHCLTIGVPGLAKTLTISTIAKALAMRFRRIQFTPDLMPSDITGTEIIDQDAATGERTFRFVHGPVFSNIVLADEINRTPPKTQAALLQAMQEHEVTAAGKTYQLEPPFFVMATQNPIEQEGTYPLPEAQLDRFMFNVFIDYPSIPEEVEIVQATTSGRETALEHVLTAEDVLALRQMVRKIPAATEVVEFAVNLVASTRPSRLGGQIEWIRRWVRWGAGPRASQYLILGAKARAVMRGRYCAAVEDVRAVAPAVLRHRIITNFHAESEGIKPIDVVRRLLDDGIPEGVPGRG